MSISSELLTLQNTKTAIRTAINNKGGSVGASDTFASYATAIDNLPSGGSGNPLLTSIDVSDFSGTTFNTVASYITDVTIPSGVTSIGQYAFQDCTAITNITFPSGLTNIGAYSFQRCTGITSITIPNTVRTVGNQAFYSCTGLTSVKIGTSLTGLDPQVFGYCRGLRSITIPSNITEIGGGALIGCSGLTSIIIERTSPPRLQYTNALSGTNDCPIYVPAESVDTYKAASGWSTYASRIYAIQQVATVDGNPVYNYEIGDTDGTVMGSSDMANMPTGTSLELAEGITSVQGVINGYTTVSLPSTMSYLGVQEVIGSSVTTLTCLAATPPSVQVNNLGGSNLTAIYVPAASVDTYKAAGGWSTHSSIIQAIPTPSATSITMTYQNSTSPVDLDDFTGCDSEEVVDTFLAASDDSTFDSDIKASGYVSVEDNNGNDVTSQCTFTSSAYTKVETDDGESEPYYEWRLNTTVFDGDSSEPHQATITATYDNLTDTFTIEWTTTSICEEPDPEEETEE